MSERPTPETDAEVILCHGIPDGFNPPNRSYVTSKFARKLERERDEVREQAQRLRVQLNHYTQANEMAEQAFSERNKAHKIAERAIDDLAWFNETNANRLRDELEQLKEGAK